MGVNDTTHHHPGLKHASLRYLNSLNVFAKNVIILEPHRPWGLLTESLLFFSIKHMCPSCTCFMGDVMIHDNYS